MICIVTVGFIVLLQDMALLVIYKMLILVVRNCLFYCFLKNYNVATYALQCILIDKLCSSHFIVIGGLSGGHQNVFFNSNIIIFMVLLSTAAMTTPSIAFAGSGSLYIYTYILSQKGFAQKVCSVNIFTNSTQI